MASEEKRWPRDCGNVVDSLWNLLRVEYGRYCGDLVEKVADDLGKEWDAPTFGAKTKREPHNQISPHMAQAHVKKKIAEAEKDVEACTDGPTGPNYTGAIIELHMAEERMTKLNQRWGQFSVEGMKQGPLKARWEKVVCSSSAEKADRDKYADFKEKNGQAAYDWYIKNVFAPEIHGKVTGAGDKYRATPDHIVKDAKSLIKLINQVKGHSDKTKKGDSPYHVVPTAGR